MLRVAVQPFLPLSRMSSQHKVLGVHRLSGHEHFLQTNPNQRRAGTVPCRRSHRAASRRDLGTAQGKRQIHQSFGYSPTTLRQDRSNRFWTCENIKSHCFLLWKSSGKSRPVFTIGNRCVGFCSGTWLSTLDVLAVKLGGHHLEKRTNEHSE